MYNYEGYTGYNSVHYTKYTRAHVFLRSFSYQRIIGHLTYWIGWLTGKLVAKKVIRSKR